MNIFKKNLAKLNIKKLPFTSIITFTDENILNNIYR